MVRESEEGVGELRNTNEALFFVGAVEHPLHAKFIGTGAEIIPPKHLLKAMRERFYVKQRPR